MNWLEELSTKYLSNVSSVFVLHGNTLDYVHHEGEYHRDPATLLGLYLQDRPVVVQYDKVQGWNFSRKPSGEQACQQFLPQAANTGSRDRYGNALQNAGVREGFPLAPTLAFPLMNKILHHREDKEEGATPWNVGLVLDYAESIFPSEKWGGSAEVDLHVQTILQWAVDPLIRSSNTLILLLCRDSEGALHPALRNPEAKIESIYLPYPDRSARAAFLSWFFHGDGVQESLTQLIEQEESLSLEEIAIQTAGLSLQMTEDCLLRCNHQGVIHSDFIKERKDSIIRQRYNDIIEITEPVHGWDAIGGLDEIKEFLIQDIAIPMKAGNLSRVPMGVLLAGAPGTGKSVMAEALAKEAGVLFTSLRFSKIFSKWVGDSERNLDRVLQVILALSPAIVFIDEIDQAGHRRGQEQTDSGVGSRVFQRLLEFMSDTHHRGKVVFLAATNRPDLLDAAMKRAGRFDVHIPFFPPDELQRKEIVKAICIKNGFTFKGKISEFFLGKTNGWVGSDLEMVCIKARNHYEDVYQKPDIVSGKALDEVIRYIRPSIAEGDIGIMTWLAMKECNDLRLLPEKFRPQVKKVTLEDTLANLNFSKDEIQELMSEDLAKEVSPRSEKEAVAG